MQTARRKRATPGTIARVVAQAIPTARCLQLREARLWLTEQGEPFCEVDLHQEGALLALRFSVHCAPAWAGIVTSILARVTAEVLVSPQGFLQDEDGRVHYGADAEAHWQAYRRVKPLLTARFTTPDPH